jgi:hypothetical protein
MHTTPEEKGRDNEFNDIIKRYFIPLENIAHVVQNFKLHGCLLGSGVPATTFWIIL